MNDFLQHVANYGYPGLFFALCLGIVGLPVPDETLLVFFGFLASTGKTNFLLTWIAAYLGSITGITVSYWLGRGLGHSVLLRYGRYIHLTEDRIQQVHRWFDRIGHWLLAIGYYIPGVRHFTALVAGLSELAFPSFMLYAYLGAAAWVTTFLGFGYLVGERWEALFKVIHRNILLTITIVLVTGGIIWLLSRRFRRKS